MKRSVSNSVAYVMIGLLLSVSAFSYAVCPIITPVDNPTYTPINPVTGENAWPIIKRSADALDDLGPIMVATANELNDLSYTTSLCCECMCYITQADLPDYVITSPGVYCVAEPIELGALSIFTNVITIQSDDVILDFRGNRLSCTTAQYIVAATSPQQRITIRNAIFDIDGAGYVIWAENITNLTIENCIVKNLGGVGIGCGSITDLLIQNCRTYLCGGLGYDIATVSGFTIENCSSIRDVQGFQIYNSTAGSVQSCYAYRSQLWWGFDTFDSTTQGVVFDNCYAVLCGADGFKINSPDITLLQCVATKNTQDGFNINPLASATNRIELIGCVATSNTGVGIRNGILANSNIFNSVSASNIGGNYINVTAATQVTSASVTAATGYWANIDG